MSDKSIFAGLAVVGIALVVFASSRSGESAVTPQAPANPGPVAPGAQLPEGHPPIQAPATTATGPEGAVLETLSGGGYTYARLRSGDEEYWVAGPPTELEAGDSVALSGTMEMGAFTSRALDRDFDRLVFTNAFVKR